MSPTREKLEEAVQAITAEAIDVGHDLKAAREDDPDSAEVRCLERTTRVIEVTSLAVHLALRQRDQIDAQQVRIEALESRRWWQFWR